MLATCLSGLPVTGTLQQSYIISGVIGKWPILSLRYEDVLDISGQSGY